MGRSPPVSLGYSCIFSFISACSMARTPRKLRDDCRVLQIHVATNGVPACGTDFPGFVVAVFHSAGCLKSSPKPCLLFIVVFVFTDDKKYPVTFNQGHSE